VIHGYLDVSNIFSLFAGRLSGKKVIWGIRASNMDLSQYDWTARWIFRLGGWLSYFPDGIITNSKSGQEHYIRNGYSAKRMRVVSNGIDTEKLYPDIDEGREIRRQWGVPDNDVLIGQVGRLDPMKDPENFLKAASKLAKVRENIRFAYIGDGSITYQQKLKELARDLGINSKLIWAGRMLELRSVYNALDLLSLSSFTEGFPNVVGEAMACGVPCVVTDVGDCRWIVGECGRVVPPGDPDALAKGLNDLMDLSVEGRREMGQQARQRIESMFSISNLVAQTQEILSNLFVDDVTMHQSKIN
jgi:glycosyltransferase involved in cell wall biosynthesis